MIENSIALTTLSNTKYYYDDFLKAVEDINSNSYLQSVDETTGTTCQIMLIDIDNQNTVALLYTTSDITITSEFNFQKSVIWDLNGHTVTFTGAGILGNKDVFYQCEVAIYGTKNGSTLKGENIDNGSTNSSTAMITDSFGKLYILGGLYYNNQTQAITSNYISGILKAVSIPDSNHGIYIYNAYYGTLQQRIGIGLI